MKKQSNPKNPNGLAEKEHQHIKPHRIIGVQKVMIDAATIGLENGRGEKVVEIDQHACKKNEVSLLPIFSKENKRNKHRENKV